ncbi:MAG: DNA-binding protein, partial [Duncaniella sp.]|nr:DNA-binding protein [Duncaniella sp.]
GVSPTMVSDGMMHFGSVDLPMGEFWFRSPTHDKPNDILDAIHGAHAYGKKIVQAEGFTEVRGTWDEPPAMIKTLLDRNYALGVNRIFYHVNAHNPWLDRRPGMTLDGIGLFFQRDNTWFEDGGRGLTDYMRRCQAMLQYGTPVVDIAVYTGEEIPRRAILPDRLVPSLPGLFGEERVNAERERLANIGQPLRTMPVGVTHSANMADPEKWIDPLRGYTYDSLNKDALLSRDTLGYPILVLPLAHPLSPDPELSPETEAKVAKFKAAGAIVPTLPYTDADFSSFGITPDALLPEEIAWCHRRNVSEGIDLYFVSNQNESPRDITASFRISGRIPELWNPMDGSIDRNLTWYIEDGRTVVEFALASAGSTFVVFREPTSATYGT